MQPRDGLLQSGEIDTVVSNLPSGRVIAASGGDPQDDDTPLPLPLVPEPTQTGFRQLNLPKLDPPRPPPGRDLDGHTDLGRRLGPVPLPGLASPPAIDDSATVPVPLLEAESAVQETPPPPLPPSPASAAAEVWLEDAVTRPSMISDLAGTSAGQASAIHAAVPAAPAFAAFSPDVAAARNARTLLILSSVTSFAVGLLLGALLWRGRAEPPPDRAQPSAAPAVCAPAETPDAPPRSQ